MIRLYQKTKFWIFVTCFFGFCFLHTSIASSLEKPRRVIDSSFESRVQEWDRLYRLGKKQELRILVALDEILDQKERPLQAFRRNLILASLGIELELSMADISTQLESAAQILESLSMRLTNKEKLELEQSLALVNFDFFEFKKRLSQETKSQ